MTSPIFLHDSHIVSCFVNVIEDNGRRYFAHKSDNRGLAWACQRAAEDEGRKVLYRIRVKFDPKFPLPKRGSGR